ncbi:MAG: hypothetical protein ACPLX7_04050 [Candidatus Kapaibacteriota bacterium]
MNNTKIFWGVFFISLGIIFIFDLLPFYHHPYHFNLKLFPLVFTFAGILILRPRKLITTIAIVLMSILLSSTIFSLVKYIKNDKIISKIYFFDCNDN